MRKRITFRKNDLIEVEWLDSSTKTGWQGDDVDIEPANCLTVGYFHSVQKKGLVLSAGRTVAEWPRQDLVDVWHIPLGCVRKMRRLR